MSAKRAVIYARCSTSHQNVDNQLLELRKTAARFGWIVSHEIVDDAVSGSKGRDQRLGFDKLFCMIQKREIDVVMAWSIDRLGRSIVDLASFMGEVQATGVDLYIEKQAINTQSASGRMIFGIFAALGEYEREIIRERIHAGLARARAEGKRLGRPSSPKNKNTDKDYKNGHQYKKMAFKKDQINSGVGGTFGHAYKRNHRASYKSL